jgi:hypothetical protein
MHKHYNHAISSSNPALRHACASTPAPTTAPGSLFCEPGKYVQPLTSSTCVDPWQAVHTCMDCPAGLYSTQPDQGSCIECLAGSITGRAGAGASTCTECAAGFYSAKSDQDTCAECVAGSITGTTGFGASACIDCPAGLYSTQSNR